MPKQLAIPFSFSLRHMVNNFPLETQASAEFWSCALSPKFLLKDRILYICLFCVSVVAGSVSGCFLSYFFSDVYGVYAQVRCNSARQTQDQPGDLFTGRILH